MTERYGKQQKSHQLLVMPQKGQTIEQLAESSLPTCKAKLSSTRQVDGKQPDSPGPFYFCCWIGPKRCKYPRQSLLGDITLPGGNSVIPLGPIQLMCFGRFS